MRELRNCDFCDAEAVGAFAIVPPELEPTEAEQRRVVCCPDCRDRLEGLLEPLLARVREGAGTGANDGRDRDGSDERSDGGGSVVATADESTATRSRDASPNATVSGGDEADASDADSADAAGSEDGITFERDERTVDAASATDVDRPADSGETDGPDVDDESGADAGSDVDGPATDGSDDERPVTDDSDAEPDRSDAPGGTDPCSATRPPAAYAKVVRLLRNREFPMQRSAVEELAAGAYDLESREVEAIVDHAIEEGEFVEKRGTLRRQ